MTPEKIASLFVMLMMAVCVIGMTYPWRDLPSWGRIAVAVIALLFGLPPLITLWITGVFG